MSMLWLLTVQSGVEFLFGHFCIILFSRLLGLTDEVLTLLLHEEAVLTVVKVNEAEGPAGLSHFFDYFTKVLISET